MDTHTVRMLAGCCLEACLICTASGRQQAAGVPHWYLHGADVSTLPCPPDSAVHLLLLIHLDSFPRWEQSSQYCCVFVAAWLHWTMLKGHLCCKHLPERVTQTGLGMHLDC